MKPEHIGNSIYTIEFDNAKDFGAALKRFDAFNRYRDNFYITGYDNEQIIPDKPEQFRMWYMRHEPRAKQTGSYRYDQDAKSVTIPLQAILDFNKKAKKKITLSKEEKSLLKLAQARSKSGAVMGINIDRPFGLAGFTQANLASGLYTSNSYFAQNVDTVVDMVFGASQEEQIKSYLMNDRKISKAAINTYFLEQVMSNPILPIKGLDSITANTAKEQLLELTYEAAEDLQLNVDQLVHM